MQLLSDFKFWAVIVSLITLILSQIPPILTLIKRARLDIELYSRLSLTHKVGNPNVSININLTNVGGRKVKIKKINALIKREGKLVANLPAVNYHQKESQNTYILTSINLEPNEEWEHTVNLLNFFDREKEKKYKKLEGEIKQNILNKRSNMKDEIKALIEADADKVTPIMAFFDESFIWTSGEYEFTICITTENNIADLEKTYRFTLFEYYEDELRKLTEYYKYGQGIYWDDRNTTANVLVDIKEY